MVINFGTTTSTKTALRYCYHFSTRIRPSYLGIATEIDFCEEQYGLQLGLGVMGYFYFYLLFFSIFRPSFQLEQTAIIHENSHKKIYYEQKFFRSK